MSDISDSIAVRCYTGEAGFGTPLSVSEGGGGINGDNVSRNSPLPPEQQHKFSRAAGMNSSTAIPFQPLRVPSVLREGPRATVTLRSFNR